MLKKSFLKLSFCFGFLAVGANAFALDFTLERDGSRYENGYDCFLKKWCGRPTRSSFQAFMGEVGSPRDLYQTVQWMIFKMKTEHLFNEGIGGHLAFATRGLWDQNGDSYITKQYLGQFKGIFIGMPGYVQTDKGVDKDINNCSNNSIPRVYWEFRFLNMTMSRFDYQGFIPNYTPPNYPIAFPPGFFITCADRNKYWGSNENGLQDRLNDHLQDGVTYTVMIHSAPDGMAYWIYREDGTLFNYNYIADNNFPLYFAENLVGDFYTQYTILPYWRGGINYIYARSNDKSGEVSMADVKRDPFASQYVQMQNTNKMIGILPIVSDNGSNPWKIQITDLNSGWFVP